MNSNKAVSSVVLCCYDDFTVSLAVYLMESCFIILCTGDEVFWEKSKIWRHVIAASHAVGCTDWHAASHSNTVIPGRRRRTTTTATTTNNNYKLCHKVLTESFSLRGVPKILRKLLRSLMKVQRRRARHKNSYFFCQSPISVVVEWGCD